MEETIKEKSEFYIHISKHIPKNQIIFGIILIMKFLPLFVITHDWNLSYKRGISFWIRKFTLSEVLSSSQFYYLYMIIVIILFILIFICSIAFYFFNILKQNKNLEKILTYILFYLFYAFNQFIYSIISEVLFNNKKNQINNKLYIIIVVISIMTIILIFYSNISLCTIFLHIPLFIKNNALIINPLNEIDYSTAVLSLIQGCIQLEFHLEFKKFITLKCITRGMFCAYCIKDFISFNKYYNRYYLEYLKKLILSACFFSCIIEWCFYYDYDNKLKILQKEFGIIFLKLVLEILFAIILTTIYFKIDSKIILSRVINFNLKTLKSFDYNIINFFNIIYYGDRVNLLETILIEFNNKLEKIIHKPKCKNKTCFICYYYSYEAFITEMENFINKQKKKEYTTLNYDFPLLYKYFYNQISSLYDSIKISDRKNIVSKLFIVITFYLIFENNEIKCLYLIEKANSLDNGNKKGFYIYQIEFLIHQILLFYKGKEHKKLNLLNSNNENIGKILFIEKLIKDSLNSIKNTMTIFNNDYVDFNIFSRIIINFNKEYKILIHSINNLFQASKCNIPYSEDKLSLYFNYVYGQIPKSLDNNFKKFFSLQSSSLIQIFMKDTYLLLFKVNFTLNDINLIINYASPDLIKKLKYSTNEFKNLDIRILFAKTFYKCYKYTIFHFLRNGRDLITIENFCLLDKDKYVILFDVEGTSLYTTNGMVLFLKLKPAKEQKLIKEKENKSNKKMNNLKNNINKLNGSCFIFTNNTGRIVSLSRGFEDFFHLKYHILRDNHLNVKDIFQIQKLDDKGNFYTQLIEVYNNIIEIFNEKIGLIGEDDFSKSIIEIKDIKTRLLNCGIYFKVNVKYEKRLMQRAHHVNKIYYLFMIEISLIEGNLAVNNTEINSSNISNSNFVSRIDESCNNNFNILSDNINGPRNIIEKIIHTSLNQKILYSNRLSYYILKKFFNTKIISNKKNEEEEIEELLESKVKKKNINVLINNTNGNERFSNDIFNDGILNVREVKRKDNKVDFKKYMVIKEDKYILRYIVLTLSILFPVLFIIMIIYKLNSLSEQEDYFEGHINFEMVGLTLLDVLSKVINMQFQGNNLQPEILENNFNNSFSYHDKQLIERIYDYNSFYIKFYDFYTGKIVGTDPHFFELYQKSVLYKIPDQSGLKLNSTAQMSSIHLSELLSPLSLNGPIPIYYNNSDYYYNKSMVTNSNISDLNYYYSATGYVGFLINFLASYKYYNNEITNYYGTHALDKKITSQKGISTFIILISMTFNIYCIIAFLVFYFQTQKLFARYFIVFTQIRFFNNYLFTKTNLIFDFIDNYQKISKIRQSISKIKFENEFEQINTVRYIITGKVEEFKNIKIKPLKLKYEGIKIEENEDSEIKNIQIENKTKQDNSSTMIRQVLKRNSIYLIPKTNTLNSISKFHSSKRISVVNEKKRSDSVINFEPHNTNFSKNNSNKVLLNNNSSNSNQIYTNKINENENNNINKNVNDKKTNLKNKEIINNVSTNRTNATSSTVTSSIHLMNISNKISENKTETGMIGNKLLSKPLLYCSLFLSLILLGILLIILSLIYYYFSFGLITSFSSIMTTFRSLFAEIKFLNEMLLDFQVSILLNKEFTTIYNTTAYSEICGELKYQFNEKITNHEMFVELSYCFPSFKPIVDSLTLGSSDKRMKNLIKFQEDTNSDLFCENYSKFLSENKNDHRLNDIKLIKNITYENLLNECKNIGNGLNDKGFSTVIVSLYTTLNNLYNQFKANNNRTAEYNIKMLNNEEFVMFQIETYYIFSKLSICYYLIMNRDMEYAHRRALNIESILLFLKLLIIVSAISIYLYNVVRYSVEISGVEFFNRCIIHMILFQ